MAYGILKCDNITFDNGGSDQNVTVSGLYRATTSGVTVSGTIAAGTVSGVTVIGSTTVSGATVTGTTANFTSGNFSNIISSAATMSGALMMANQQQVRFREAVGNGVNHIALQAPAIVSADQTITLPDQTGTVVTTGDNGSVTSTMILDGTILNADINASAAIADTKLATISTAGKVSGTAITSGNIATSGNLAIASNAPSVTLEESDGTATHSQAALVKNDDSFQIQTRSGAGVFVSQDYAIATNASGATDHLWRIAGTEKARLNSAGLTVVNDLTISDKIIHAGDTNTAIRFPAVDTVTVETNGAERLRIDSSGRVGIGTPSDGPKLLVYGNGTTANTLSVVNPSATNGAIIYLGDSNQSSAIKTIPAGGTHSLGFFVAGSNTERLRIDSSGNVGIGTSSPGYALDVAAADTTASTGYAVRIRANATAGAGALQFTDSAATVQYGLLVFDANGVGTLQAEGASSRLAFGTNATERLRIDSSGRLLVGTSSARSNFFNSTITANILLENDNAVLGVVRNGNNAFSSYLVLAKSRSGSNTIVQADDQLGTINFQGNDGTEFVEAAQISAFVDGTPGANDMPGRLVFSTAADGAAFTTERLRITSAGVLQVADAGNITVGTTTGTKIGTATTQKIGFYNATPVVQPTAVADATDATTVITQLNALLTRMRNLGLIAT